MHFCFCPQCAALIIEDGGRERYFTCSGCQKFWMIVDIIEVAAKAKMAMSRLMDAALVVPALKTERTIGDHYKEVAL